MNLYLNDAAFVAGLVAGVIGIVMSRWGYSESQFSAWRDLIDGADITIDGQVIRESPVDPQEGV